MPRVSPHPALADVPRWLRTMYNRCQPWNGTVDANGYPRAKSVYAHRAAYERLWGRLEPGERVYRRCGDRTCVNPFHLTTDKSESPQRQRRRVRARSTKLSWAKAEAIRVAWARPDRPTQQELADEYGVSRSAISLVVRGVTWGGAEGVGRRLASGYVEGR